MHYKRELKCENPRCQKTFNTPKVSGWVSVDLATVCGGFYVPTPTVSKYGESSHCDSSVCTPSSSSAIPCLALLPLCYKAALS